MTKQEMKALLWTLAILVPKRDEMKVDLAQMQQAMQWIDAVKEPGKPGRPRKKGTDSARNRR